MDYVVMSRQTPELLHCVNIQTDVVVDFLASFGEAEFRVVKKVTAREYQHICWNPPSPELLDEQIAANSATASIPRVVVRGDDQHSIGD